MKVVVKVYLYEAERVAKQVKSRQVRKVAKVFAQNLIDRYFSTEYLDADEIKDELNEKLRR